MIAVKATREGLIGGKTASGYTVDIFVPFVALPATKAIGRSIWLFNPSNNRTCKAIVLDIGPWNTKDNSYVFEGARPQAESGTDLFGRKTNKAGIDLGEKVWNLLGMTGNSYIVWSFI